MGNKTLTDGVWAFPEGFAHYLREHSLKPDAEFLDHVRQNQYRVPELVPPVPLVWRNCVLLDRLEKDLKAAMKARESLRVSVLRVTLSEAKNAGRRRGDNMTDEDVAELLRIEVEKREEAASLYRQGNRPDLADKEIAEAAILRAYMTEPGPTPPA